MHTTFLGSPVLLLVPTSSTSHHQECSLPTHVLADEALWGAPRILEVHFNYCLCRYHMNLQCTIGHLKGCWQALSMCLKVEEEDLQSPGHLQNICEIQGEIFQENWAEES